MGAAACPWELDVNSRYIQPIDFQDLPPKEQQKFVKDQRKKEKNISKQEVIEDLSYYIPNEENYDDRDAPSAFSAIFGKSSSSSQSSDDSKKSNKSIFSKMKKSSKKDQKPGGEWKKIP